MTRFSKLENIEIGQTFNQRSFGSSEYVLLEKNAKTLNGMKYAKIQHKGIELTGIDFKKSLENSISYYPQNLEVYNIC